MVVLNYADGDLAKRRHVERAWDHWNKIGAPKLVVAPMMDQSELPFRMLCRKYGATAAYTPMFHSRPFALQRGYRRVEFTTCPVSHILLFFTWCLFLVQLQHNWEGLCEEKESLHLEFDSQT